MPHLSRMELVGAGETEEPVGLVVVLVGPEEPEELVEAVGPVAVAPVELGQLGVFEAWLVHEPSGGMTNLACQPKAMALSLEFEVEVVFSVLTDRCCTESKMYCYLLS